MDGDENMPLQDSSLGVPSDTVAHSTGTSPAGWNDAPIEADSPSTVGSPPQYAGSVAADSFVFNYETENGRTYHGYRGGTYYFPNDPSEIDRLNLQYEMLKYAFHDRNYFAPLSNPRYILDVGTGTGQWAIEMGDAFPEAEVQATDLSPIQPQTVPENVHFYIDDASEDDWAVPPAHFDYIHTRVLIGCFTDFRDIIRKGFYYTKPGGHMESQEMNSIIFCDDGTMPSNWPFKEWLTMTEQAASEAGRPIDIAHKLKRWYEEAGFVDVREEIVKLPMNTWPRDPHLKNLGRMMEGNWHAGLNAFSMAYFTRILNWNKTEIEVYLVRIRQCISDKSVHVYHKVHVVWGRKPFDGEIIPKPAPPAAVATTTATAGSSSDQPLIIE